MRKVQRRRARIQLHITSQEDEDESSMIDGRKKRKKLTDEFMKSKRCGETESVELGKRWNDSK